MLINFEEMQILRKVEVWNIKPNTICVVLKCWFNILCKIWFEKPKKLLIAIRKRIFKSLVFLKNSYKEQLKIKLIINKKHVLNKAFKFPYSLKKKQ